MSVNSSKLTFFFLKVAWLILVHEENQKRQFQFFKSISFERFYAPASNNASL